MKSSEEIDRIVDSPSNTLQWAKRVSFSTFNIEMLSKNVMEDSEVLVISDVLDVLETRGRNLFTWEFLRENYSEQEITPRDVVSLVDVPGYTLGKYLDYIEKQEGKAWVKGEPILYGKDIDCPVEWSDCLKENLDPLFYHTGNDLSLDLPEHIRPITLMNYIGHSYTRTPAHLDICGSLGHNFMVNADPNAHAYWFCAKGTDLQKVEQFWDANSEAPLRSEHEFMDLSILTKATFPIFVIKQRPGDLVIVPPLAVHQVINMNGRSIKVAWNRIVPRCLDAAFSEINIYHVINKPEVYKVRAMVYYALKNRVENSANVTKEDFLHILTAYKTVYHNEKSPKDMFFEKYPENDAHMVTCNVCKGDIFNRCYQCTECKDCDICFYCVMEHRRCTDHNKKLMETLPFDELTDLKERAEKLLYTMYSGQPPEIKEPDETPICIAAIVAVKANDRRVTVVRNGIKFVQPQRATSINNQMRIVNPHVGNAPSKNAPPKTEKRISLAEVDKDENKEDNDKMKPKEDKDKLKIKEDKDKLKLKDAVKNVDIVSIPDDDEIIEIKNREKRVNEEVKKKKTIKRLNNTTNLQKNKKPGRVKKRGKSEPEPVVIQNTVPKRKRFNDPFQFNLNVKKMKLLAETVEN